MLYRLLADTVLFLHLLFILFVAAGGLLVLRRPRLAWLHLPAVAWAFLIEWYRLPCPLTPMEKWALSRAGEAAYEGGFISHYLIPLIYPGPMPIWMTTLLAILVVLINTPFYVALIVRRRRQRPPDR